MPHANDDQASLYWGNRNLSLWFGGVPSVWSSIISHLMIFGGLARSFAI